MRKKTLAFAAGKFVRAVAASRQQRMLASEAGRTTSPSGSAKSATRSFIRMVENNPAPGRRSRASGAGAIYLKVVAGCLLIVGIELFKLWLGY